MERRIRTLSKASPTVTVPTFGDSANLLRITQLNEGLDSQQSARILVSVNTGAAPDTDLEGDAAGTFHLNPNGEPSVFEEAAPSTPWDVRLTLISNGDDPQIVVVEIEEF